MRRPTTLSLMPKMIPSKRSLDMNQLCLAVRAVLVGLLFAVPVWANNPNRPEAWTAATYEDDPADSDAVGQGDDHMRAIKTEVRERLEVEHHFGTDNADDTGLHRLGSGRCFAQSAAPTTLEDSITDHVNTAGGQSGVTNLNTDATAGAEDVGLGRCWIDTDDMTLYFYATAELEGSGATPGWVPAAPGQLNLLYNGSFEVDDGSGTPDGWTNDDLTIVAGSVADVSDDIYGPYIVYGVVNPTAGDTCSIVTTGAGTQASVTTTNAGGFEALLDTFVVADPTAAVVVRLESDAAADVCEWDHVAVVEYGQRPQLPDRIVDQSCIAFGASSAATVTALEALSVRVQIPWPKSVIRVSGKVYVPADVSYSLYVTRNVDGAGANNWHLEQGGGDGASTFVDEALEWDFLDVNPTPGSEYVYAIAFIGGGGTLDVTLDNPTPFCIQLEAYPL
jgi:hypothetical protein